ncbi:histidine kinase [Ammoniphilus oxalaticus]|uniref:Signal transduction histidine-protein kinase/phosphatase DegS n=1 Tax=Ammoniphilus oxalaticus TaxID=66863 RepID=A0A419SF93_9BACL|nr:histidine kinase [Ammoniphilus oxalaticus]
MPLNIDLTHLDDVLKKTISTVEGSKGQIFDIAEQARQESLSATQELERIQRDITDLLESNDRLEEQFQASRRQLANVSRGFERYEEADVKQVYDIASQLQVELSIAREKESHLRTRRDSLERRLRNLEGTIEKADNIMAQMQFVLTFLSGELENINIAFESAEERRMFPMQIIQAQEDERKRVARDIHDGPAQSMANVVVRSEFAERILAQGRIEEAQQELKDLKETVRNTLGEVRKIIFDLRPMALDDLGLIPTLRKYVDDFGQRHHIGVELITGGEEQRLPSTVEVVTFRMIQEAMNNAAKHAKADHVLVRLTFSPNCVNGEVRDDGIGFEYKKKTGQPSFGIMGMKERMKLLRGEVEIESSPGEGTSVTFTIPLQAEVGIVS